MTQHSNPHHPLVLRALQHVFTDRLQRAVTALAAGTMTVTLTRQTDMEIRAQRETDGHSPHWPGGGPGCSVTC